MSQHFDLGLSFISKKNLCWLLRYHCSKNKSVKNRFPFGFLSILANM